jgi:integrase
MAAGLTLRTVRALGPGAIVWDHTIPGFCARRRDSEAVFYGLKYRTSDGRQRWFTIGRHGAPWTPDLARAEALRLLGEITGATTAGIKADPALSKQTARKGLTVAALCKQYFGEAEAGRLLTKKTGKPKTAATLRSDASRIARHIEPLLGDRSVRAITRADIEAFLHDVAEGKTAADGQAQRGASSRTVGLLGAIFAYAVKQGIRPDNPCSGVQRFADGKRERRLSNAEYRALGAALREAEASNIWPPAIAAIRFAILTGWRSGEVTGLLWPRVDIERRTVRLVGESATKTGDSVRALSRAACAVLETAGRPNDGLVFPSTRAGTLLELRAFWDKVTAIAGLTADITPHTLRHSFASVAADIGISELLIAGLIGHRKSSVTGRYVHSADQALLDAADATANHIAALMAS